MRAIAPLVCARVPVPYPAASTATFPA